jgi:alkylation response protein AidB-like acyl-CoA dehydrogenase
VHFGLNDDQQVLQDTVRRFFTDHAPVEAARALLETELGQDPGLWRRMASELELLSLAVPEKYGGAGASFVELAVVTEEMGRQLVTSAWFSSAVLASCALLNSGDDTAIARYLPAIATGESIATLAVIEDGGSWKLEDVALVVEPCANGYRLSGHKSFVTDGGVADVLLVVARCAQGLCLLAVDADAAGVTRRMLPVLDGTRRLARIEFDGTPAVLIGAEGQAEPGLRRALDQAAIALAAEQVGGAQHCLDMAVAYAGTRVAFGRPIGSFQSIKHKCADLYVGIEAARSAVYQAAWSVAVDSDDLPFVAAATQAHCSEVYLKAAHQNIQIHGGIGFSWEHDAQLYLKRARSSRELLGAPELHLSRIADGMGL